MKEEGKISLSFNYKLFSLNIEDDDLIIQNDLLRFQIQIPQPICQKNPSEVCFLDTNLKDISLLIYSKKWKKVVVKMNIYIHTHIYKHVFVYDID